MDPVDHTDFNINNRRDPNPETIAQIKALAMEWRAAVEEANNRRAELHYAVLQAKDAGHSFSQLREATGLGTGTIQMILAKNGR